MLLLLSRCVMYARERERERFAGGILTVYFGLQVRGGYTYGGAHAEKRASRVICLSVAIRASDPLASELYIYLYIHYSLKLFFLGIPSRGILCSANSCRKPKCWRFFTTLLQPRI